MSSRTSRRNAGASTSSRQSTPRESTPSTSERPRSPLSPTRYSRMAEKAELQNLNDRLASYIEAVQSLEAENNILSKQVTISQETISKETTAYRFLYEQELKEARDILDRTATEKARLEIDNKRIREENEELKSSLDKTTRENRKYETELNQLEQRFADLQPKYNRVASELKKAKDELKEFETAKKNWDGARKFLENETLIRVEMENKIQSLKEELNFKEQVYQREVSQLRTKKREEISEIDGRLTVEYEFKLQSALKELREQYEQQVQSNREEIIQLYEHKIQAMEEHNLKNSSANNASLEELRELQSRYEAVSAEVSALEASNAGLKSRLRDLEQQLEKERTRNVQRLTTVEEELTRAREEMSNQIKDYHDLLDIKVALDSEIAAYRKLLEFEEQRLSGLTSPGGRGTPQRRGTPLKNLKRRRVVDEAESSECFKVSGEARGDIEVSDVCPEGKFVQLFNKGEKEVALGGWVLKHQANNQDTVFKFHRSVKIEPNGNVTVWGCDTGHAHEPPHHIVMKQKWFTGDPSTTVVVNSDGDEVARRLRERVQSSSFRQETEDTTDDTDPRKEQCILM